MKKIKETPAPMLTSSDGIPGMGEGMDIMPWLRPYVRHCGNEPRPPWHMNDRKLLDYLFVYIAEGYGEVIIDGVRYDAQAHDLFWIPPDTLHSMSGTSPRMVCPYVHCDLVYRPGVSHWDFSIPVGMTDLSELTPLAHPPVKEKRITALKGRHRGTHAQRAGELISEICTEAARARPYGQLTLSALIVRLIAELLRAGDGLSEPHIQHLPAIERAARWLREHLGEAETSIDRAATVAELSESHFRKLFSIHYGISPRTYLRRARIRKAKILMLDPSRTLGEISRIVGFTQLHSLTRAFEAEEGMPPSHYRTCGARAVTRVDQRDLHATR